MSIIRISDFQDLDILIIDIIINPPKKLIIYYITSFFKKQTLF